MTEPVMDPERLNIGGVAPEVVFEALGQATDNELAHFLAFGLYFTGRTQFAEEHERHHGVAAEPDAYKIFDLAATTEQSLAGYITQAEILLSKFGGSLIENQDQKNRHAYERQLVEELKKSRPFWKSVWENIVASLGAAAIIALFILIAWTSKVGIAPVAKALFDDKTPEVVTKPATPTQAPEKTH